MKLWILLALTFCTTIAGAQVYSIPLGSFTGGGGTSATGGYALSGTIAQPFVGTMNGGAYSVTGGRWAILGTVQTPGAPALSIYPTATNAVLITWAAPGTGFVLQSNQNIGTTNWVNLNQAPVDNGRTRSILVGMPSGYVFFRLKK